MAEWSNTPDLRLTADGKALEYACWGPEPSQAPTIVLLHEALGSVALWRDLPQLLSKATGFGVLAYSRAGFGSSDPVALPRPKTYHAAEADPVLPQVMDALDLRQVILVGHSDGATIAALHAGNAPDARVRGMVLIAPHFFTEPAGIEAVAEAGKAYQTGGLKTKLAKYHDHVDVTFRGWHDTWTDPAFADWNIEDVIPRWQMPVLAIQGADDQYGTLAQIDTITDNARCVVERLIIKNCGHVPHFEKPDLTIEAINRFCQRTIPAG